MNEPFDDRPIEGLASLTVVEPGATFWSDLHERLVAGDDTPDDRTVVVLPVADRRPERDHRRLLGAAAAVAVLVAGLVVFALVRHGDTRPSQRIDVVIDDPRAIDLDDLRREEFGWERHPSGPYPVFDLQTLDQQRWSTSDGGYEVADTRALWDWEWSGQILSAINEPLAWQIEVRAPQTAPLRVPDGEPIDVRGTTGVLVEPTGPSSLQPEVAWIERGTLVELRWIRDAPFDLDATLDIAERLTPTTVDGFGDIQIGPGSWERPETPVLAGEIGGESWWVDLRPADDGSDQLTVVVDGAPVGSIGHASAPVLGRADVPLYWGRGRIYAGRTEGLLADVEAVLSSGTTVNLPVHVEGDTTVWAVPIPIGLDVVQLRFVRPAGDQTAVPRPIAIPPFTTDAIPTAIVTNA
jgi:hypothetical protein